MMLDLLKRWRWALLIAAALVAGLAYAFWPASSPVDTARVTRGPMAVGITDDGVTRAHELYVVSAPVSGYLSRIELEVGDSVARGTLITRITGRPSTPLDPRSTADLRAALGAARAAEDGAAASLAQAQRDALRAETLAKRGFLPRAQLEEARTRVASGRAALALARAEIARIHAQARPVSGADGGNPVEVRAPASGAVLSVITESAGVVGEGTPLMAIGDPARIEVVVDLLSREAVRVKVGDPVEITQWGGAAALTGRVQRIEPFGKLKVSALGIEEQRVNVIVAFDAASLPQAARLGHGYQLDATVILWRKDQTLRVPIGALYRGVDGGWRVLAIEHGRASERTVRLGRINNEFGEVLDGLAAGQLLVLNPGSAIRDGARVKPR